MTTYSTRNSKNVPLIKVNHIFFFKNNYFLSTIIQCNKLDPDICGSSSSLIFQKTFLEYVRPSPSGIFNVCRSVGLNYLTRLQVGLVPNSNISFVMIFGTPYSRLWQRYQNYWALSSTLSKLYVWKTDSPVNHMRVWFQSSLFEWKPCSSDIKWR